VWVAVASTSSLSSSDLWVHTGSPKVRTTLPLNALHVDVLVFVPGRKVRMCRQSGSGTVLTSAPVLVVESLIAARHVEHAKHTRSVMDAEVEHVRSGISVHPSNTSG
jgi:hypothetical protein